MSLIVMFPTTMTQKAEEDLLNQVDDYSNENFLKRLREDHLAGNGEPTEQMAHLQQQMMKHGAILGGEQSSHICIRDNYYCFDDGLYAAARLLQIIDKLEE
ncbi:MAG: hypothetical protein HN996_13290, partial [Opitutae bacterium]|nr:hypothetical protein [Opitutae bacterium]